MFGVDSVIPFKDNVLFNISTIFLIVSGGLGFIVIDELVTKHSFRKLSIHSKLVLTITTALILLGMFIFKFAMFDEITWLQALFTSVTC